MKIVNLLLSAVMASTMVFRALRLMRRPLRE